MINVYILKKIYILDNIFVTLTSLLHINKSIIYIPHSKNIHNT